MSDTKVKFATKIDASAKTKADEESLASVETQADEESLASVEIQAEQEERQTPTPAYDTITDLLDPRKYPSIRPQVLAAYRESLERFGKLYEKLAK